LGRLSWFLGRQLVSELRSAQCIPSGISAPMRGGSSPCVRGRLLGIVPHGELWVGRRVQPPNGLAFWGECRPNRPKTRCYAFGRVCRGPTAWGVWRARCASAARFQHLVSELRSAQCIPSGISAPMREGSSPCVRRLLGIVPHGELWVGKYGLYG